MNQRLPRVQPMAGAEFRRLRERLGLSQAALGRVLDRTDQTISNWETGDADVDPTAALAIRKLVQDAQAQADGGEVPGRAPVKPQRFQDVVRGRRG